MLPDTFKSAGFPGRTSYWNGGKDSEVLYGGHCPTDELAIAFKLYHAANGE
jgi:hypothetical protein